MQKPISRKELYESLVDLGLFPLAQGETLKVLVVDSFPRWEYRFLRNALERDPGVEVSCLLFHPQLGKGQGRDYLQEFPAKPEELAKYDVIFLGDVGSGSTTTVRPQCSSARQ